MSFPKSQRHFMDTFQLVHITCRPHSRCPDISVLAVEPLHQAHSRTVTALWVQLSPEPPVSLSPAGDVSHLLLCHADELIPPCCCQHRCPGTDRTGQRPLTATGVDITAGSCRWRGPERHAVYKLMRILECKQRDWKRGNKSDITCMQMCREPLQSFVGES